MRSSTKGKMASNPAAKPFAASTSRIGFPGMWSTPSFTTNTVSRSVSIEPSMALESYVVSSLISSRSLCTAGSERGLSDRMPPACSNAQLPATCLLEYAVTCHLPAQIRSYLPPACSNTQLPAICLLKYAVACHLPAQMRSYLPPACSNTQLPAICLLKYAVTCYIPAIWLVGNQYPKRSGHGVDHHARMRRMPERLRARPPITSRSFLQRRPS